VISFTLAGPPRGKERVKTARDGHAYTPERTVSFEGRLAYAAQQAMGDRPPLEGPIRVVMRAYFAIPQSKPAKWKAAALAGKIRPVVKPDSDNILKCIDSGNLILWVDDRQVVEAFVAKFYSDRPRTEVEVHVVGAEEDVFG
jgi:Holliday junction resolvase RusA-like endonuclease